MISGTSSNLRIFSAWAAAPYCKPINPYSMRQFLLLLNALAASCQCFYLKYTGFCTVCRSKYSRTSKARIPWEHENMFETGLVRANECKSSRQVRRYNRDIFSIFFSLKVCCVFSLELPHRDNSNEDTQYTINHPKSAAIGFFFIGSHERVRNSPGKWGISVWATEDLLCSCFKWCMLSSFSHLNLANENWQW